MQYNKIDFSGITNWDQTNEAIAKQLGCCDKSVRTARRARGLPKAPDKSKRSILKAKLKQVGDKAWMTYNNHQIARILKCSVTAVRMYRIIHWKPAHELPSNTHQTPIK
jgi:hypothetical protein